MEHEDVIARLRALGKQPVSPVAAAQLGGTSGAAARPRRWPAVAAASLAALTLTTGVVAGVNGTGRPATVGVGDRPDPVPPEGALSCDGPPPFAGEPTSSEPGRRAVEAGELEQWRAENCPAPTTERAAPAEPVANNELAATNEHADDPCTGPPTFAGTPAEPADPTASDVPSPRASEAAAHAAERQACAQIAGDSEATTEPADDPCTGQPPFAGVSAEPADPTASIVPSSRASEAAALAAERQACAAGTAATDATNAPAGVPQGAPTRTPGPPPGVPQGPREETPNGPRADTPQGPPEETPNGPPADAPQGPPEETPNGSPADAPQGPPEETPNGPPADAPQGPPEETPDPTEVAPIESPVVMPGGGADDAPGGPPDDAPAGRGGRG